MSIFNNYPLMAASVTFLVTQIIKIPFAMLMGKDASAKLLISTGGMPSSHSAGVSAITTALIIEYGIGSPLVAVSWVFGSLVMYDAMHVRRQSGDNAVLIRQMLIEIQQMANEKNSAQKKSLSEISKTLRPINLGHKPAEVLVGMVFGIFMALLFKKIFY